MRAMRGRAAARLAWTAWAVCLALALLNLGLNLVEPASLDPLLPRPFPPPVAVEFLLTLMAFPTVGALIASRQPTGRQRRDGSVPSGNSRSASTNRPPVGPDATCPTHAAHSPAGSEPGRASTA